MITIPTINQGDSADEDALNSRFALIMNKTNGGIESGDILNNSVSRAKIGTGAITQAKMDNTFTWTVPTLVNSWRHWGGGTTDLGQLVYYKDARGYVHFRGGVDNSAGSTGNTITTLPVGFRPDKRLIFLVSAGSGLGRIDVDTSGNVVHQNGPGTTGNYYSLSGIHFRAV